MGERREKTGLVLEGGGMRGIYTAGVLDVFLDHGISFDGVIGVSAGAIHGCSFVSGQRGRSIRYYSKYCADPRFMSVRNLLRTGEMAGREFCYHTIPERLDPYDYEAFHRSQTAFYVTCSNVETGRAEHLRITDMRKQIELVRASASLPLISPIVEVDGMKLLDGGCCDSIPIRAFRRLGYRRNVIILTRPKGYQKKAEHTGLVRLAYRRYPQFVRAMANRHLTYNRTLKEIARLEEAGRAFVIRPSVPLQIGRMEGDPDKLRAVYEIGAADAKRALRRLLEWKDGN